MKLREFLRIYDGLKDPVAVVLAEDRIALEETVRHKQALGFPTVVVVGECPAVLPDGVFHVDEAIDTPAQALDLLNRIVRARRDVWLYYGYNAEFLFFPFCEKRGIADALRFMAEERRQHVFCYALDLYAGDIAACPGGVDAEAPLFDGVGYYGAERRGENGPLARQPEVFGGLRRRFEEHMPHDRRRIDRISVFQTCAGLEILPDYRLNNDEMNTISCPWHHNMTMAVMSFRVAKALRHNPGSAEHVSDFRWSGSVPFAWSSAQLLEMGFIEPGQWF